MPIIVAVKLLDDDDHVRRVGCALASRLRTPTVDVVRHDLSALAARVQELRPLLVVSGSATRPERKRLGRAVPCPILFVPDDSSLGGTLDAGAAVKVTLALGRTAKADAAVIRTARALRSALRCELTLLCSDSVAEDLATRKSYDLAIVGDMWLDVPAADAITKPLLVVTRSPARGVVLPEGAALAPHGAIHQNRLRRV